MTIHLHTAVLTLSMAATIASSCSQSGSNKPADDYSDRRTEMEAKAQTFLAEARTSFANGNHAAAKQRIETMRKDCYLAITARKEGILLMDSIDIEMARRELVKADSTAQAAASPDAQAAFDEACKKVEFYERKLKHDLRTLPHSGLKE